MCLSVVSQCVTIVYSVNAIFNLRLSPSPVFGSGCTALFYFRASSVYTVQLTFCSDFDFSYASLYKPSLFIICIAHIILLSDITAKLYHVNKIMYRDIIKNVS